ncbi:hypothetical protein VB712_07390 [Spirulina sp. CCNP1310]|uniref:hypothetical protein n=1 Tax=Spirulina sp. CCNP1310 TaxID=3110249 RepID=UPI002B20467D|nr:hypothetical protein [Spirulina sp. CCNP1310]MEA5419048.1 hypothetical protein [Spirulina sp. CCNP1310]
MKFRLWPVVAIALTLLLSVTLAGCGGDRSPTPPPAQVNSGNLTETAPPPLIRQLQPALELYQPQITILNPKPDTVLKDATVEVSIKVEDLPLFTAPDLEIGPHVNVILDNQPAIPIYGVEKPLTFTDLTPGTHTLRVFAVTPWGESFKNDGAFAQTEFSILTANRQNNPDPHLPLLTYNSPQGTYGAEPILLDFYLTNAPLKNLGTPEPLSDWRIRVTVNQQTFLLDRWQPLYLKGFKPGLNAVKLEFLNGNGEPVDNVFNNVVQVVNYQPGNPDPLAALIRGELSADQARALVDPGFTPDVLVEPEAIAPEIPEVPEVVEPEAIAPEIPEVPEVVEPEAIAPEIPEVPEVVEPEAIAPEIPEAPEVIEPEAIAPEIPEAPEVIEPEAIAPEIPEVPEVVEPEAIAPEIPVAEDQPQPEQTETIDPIVAPETPQPKRNWGEAFQRWRKSNAPPMVVEPETPDTLTAEPEAPVPEAMAEPEPEPEAATEEPTPEPPATMAPTVE